MRIYHLLVCGFHQLLQQTQKIDLSCYGDHIDFSCFVKKDICSVNRDIIFSQYYLVSVLNGNTRRKCRIDVYIALLEHIVQSRKGALPFEMLRMALKTVRKQHPKLIFMTIDQRFKIISMMPDKEDSLLAVKIFLDELYKSLCLLTDDEIARHILVHPSLEFSINNKIIIQESGILDFLPDFMTDEVARFMEVRRSSMDKHGDKEEMINKIKE